MDKKDKPMFVKKVKIVNKKGIKIILQVLKDCKLGKSHSVKLSFLPVIKLVRSFYSQHLSPNIIAHHVM